MSLTGTSWDASKSCRNTAPEVLYLDVTSSCKSPMNTGVQRVVRALHRALAGLTAVTPLVWDPGLGAYCTLSRRELNFLERPFGPGGAARGGDAEPGRRANPIPFWSKFARTLDHRRNRLDLPARLTAVDTLFVPEIFQDNRLEFLPALAARTSARLAAVCHDALAWSRPEVIPPARQAGFAAYLDALGRFGHVIACSHETADDLHAFWHARGATDAVVPPVAVHPWPVDHDGTPRQVLPPPAALIRKSVLCVGTFEPRKNHLGLLAATERLWQGGEPFDLVLIGRTTAHHGAAVLTQIQSIQRAGCPVHWLRHSDDSTLRRAYADCTFTVFPSLYEGFGLPILESLWHGRPCVCGANGAIGEVAAAGGCLTVDQTDPAALAAGMERLLNDTPLYQKLCAEAEARPFGSWEQLAREILASWGQVFA